MDKYKKRVIPILLYSTDFVIIEHLRANYECSIASAVRMIIRAWGKELEFADNALALGQIMPHEHRQRINELTTLAVR